LDFKSKNYLSSGLQIPNSGYLKDSLLMQWMTAMTVTDELGIKALANEYHPRPKTSYKYIRNKAIPWFVSSRATKFPLLVMFLKACRT
jgi:hypothetical protein